MKEKIQRYFNEELSSKEILEMQIFMAEHADEPIVSEALEQEFNDISADTSIDSDSALQSIKNQLGIRTHRKSFAKPLRVIELAFALLAVPLGISLFLSLRPKAPSQWQEMRVPCGQTESLVLSDGTRLDLGGGSRLIYPDSFEGDIRKVFLEGSLIADVTSDAQHPFIIQSGDAEVKVYGTRFEFKDYAESECLEVWLEEGIVDLNLIQQDSSRRVVRLNAGDVLQYNRNTRNITMRSLGQMKLPSSSADHLMYFLNIPLKDIAIDLNKAFGTPVIILDDTLAQTRFYALFSNGEGLDEILSSLNTDGKMRIDKREGRILLSTNYNL